MIDSYTKTPRPLRHVDVDYLVDQTNVQTVKINLVFSHVLLMQSIWMRMTASLK